MDFETRKRYFNLCDPTEALDPDDERNVDIDRESGARVRGTIWIEKLAQEIELSDKNILKLVSGLPGSGKSTELRRLVRRLEDPEAANYLTVLIDAEQTLDLTAEIDIPDVLAVIIYELERTILRLENQHPDAALHVGFLARTWQWLTQTDVTLKAAEFAVPNAGTLLFELKTRESLRQQFRRIISSHLPDFLRRVQDEVEQLSQRARAIGRRGVVVLVDTLEKLRGTSQNYEGVLDSAERMFKGGAPHLRLPVHTIYMVPAALYARGIRVELLPMIKLRHKDGTIDQLGESVARQLIRRRVPDPIMAEVLGESIEQRLKTLIRWSGGYPREIVRMTQQLLTHEHQPLTDQILAQVRNEVTDGYRAAITVEDFEWLASVHIEQFVTFEGEAHRQSADRMLTMNAVMRYCNEDAWWDIHPAVAEIPGVAAAIQSRRSKQKRQRKNARSS